MEIWNQEDFEMMKKRMVTLCVTMLVFLLAACGGKGEEGGQSDGGQPGQEGGAGVSEEESESSEESAPAEAPEESGEAQPGESADTSGGYEEGWSEEMEKLKNAAVEALDGDYWPDTALLPDMLEMTFGISSDMYEDYMAEVPMISANVDTLLIVRAKDDKVEAVRDALEAYRDAQINNTMQYPVNVGKVQASRIETVGNYVMFVQLGGDTMQAAEEGDEAVVAMCQEINDKAVEAIRGRL